MRWPMIAVDVAIVEEFTMVMAYQSSTKPRMRQIIRSHGPRLDRTDLEVKAQDWGHYLTGSSRSSTWQRHDVCIVR